MSDQKRELLDSPPAWRGPQLRCRLWVQGTVVERRGVVVRSYANDVLAIEATDSPGLMPRLFFVREGADWQHLTDWLLKAWGTPHLSLPPGFVPLKRIPEGVVERMREMGVEERKTVLQQLRHQRFLPRLMPLSSGYLPNSVSRQEVASLCFLAPGEQPQR